MRKFILSWTKLCLPLLTFLFIACQTQQAQPEYFTIEVALIALGDGSITDEQVMACGDSIQMIEAEFPSNSEVGTIEAALETLFAVEGSTYGESGLYNALYQSDIIVESVVSTKSSSGDSTVDVTLSGSIVSGGVCDDPRIEEQIRATVEANAPEGAVITILFDGEDLHEYFDLSGL